MQLIGQAIRHDTFGKGVVTGWDRHTLTVCFSEGDKRFLFPDAFEKHLTLRNDAMQETIESLLQKKEAEREARQQAVQEEQERRHRMETLKVSENSQAAFQIPAEQLETPFSDWSVSTGVYLSGGSKGEPRIPDRMKPNSLCLLTHRASGAAEGTRRILGAFMVEEDFFGNLCRNGVIHAHPACRMALAPEEQPLFWPYFTQEPARQRWGNTAMKYFSNRTAEQILWDLVNSRRLPEQQAAANDFYAYFCAINHLPSRLEQADTASGS